MSGYTLSEAVLPASDAAELLARFALGYLAVIAAPGPNMLAIATLAALRGFRGVLPLCAGLATGAGVLAASLLMAFGAMSDTTLLEEPGRIIGGGLLLVIALRIARTPPPRLDAVTERRGAGLQAGVEAFGGGFCTAACNPITAAYFAAQFLGPLAEAGVQDAVLLMVPVQVLLCGLAVAAVFAQPGARRAAAAHHRAVCLVSGLLLAGLAAMLVAPALAGP